MDRTSIAGFIIGFALVLISNIPIVQSLWHRQPPNLQLVDYYGDEDGEATEISIKALNDKRVRWSIAAVSLVGLILAFITATLKTIETFHEAALLLIWMQFASWLLSCFQSIVFFTETSVTRRFELARHAFWTSLGLLALAFSDKPLWPLDNDTTMAALHIATFATAAFRAFCCVLLPRRPDVYHEGKLVDREHTVSLWSRLTFSFVTPLVRFVGQNQGTTTVDDLPELPNRARSQHLHDGLRKVQQQSRSLLHALCSAHSRGLVLQLILSVASGVLTFGPPIALYGILRSLEDDSAGSPGIFVAALGITMFLASSLGSWLWWITYSYLCIPIYSQLTALLYSKSMRRKDVHSAKSTKNESESAQEQTQQDIINLVTVDTKRISDFTSYNHLIPSSMTQLIIGCALLLRLIGWQPLLAGLGANLINIPCNMFIGVRYKVVQQGLMQARDERTSIVHEVIKNIRQVKFSSLEFAWRDRILEARRREMGLNFKACYFETFFQAVWTLAPLLLSTVSLTVYAIQNGHLESSVAFTAISIFGSLEVALAALPHLIFTALEAKISVDRIDRYFGGADKPEALTNEAECIQFQDATIAWPVSENDENTGFHLSRLSLQFPSKGLGVITGRTGSGKSLLLSSMLGEAEIISGSIHVPYRINERWERPPKDTDDWIIDSAIAYVAQNPWTENGTIRDNILFGLPLNRSRYQKVLFASGLERDLDILEGGDQTDIGANGINLSGGQRLRVSFARALYSRAGILIMDDIFSALDADTSRHVYEYGLIGELAQRRTRILATHHIGLCLPRTDYCVVLANGHVSCAGSVEDLRNMDIFADLLTSEDGQDLSSDKASYLPGSGARDLTEIDQQGKKFSPEEHRATGAVPLSLYKKYITSDKSPWMWCLGITAAILFTTFIIGRGWWLSVWTSADNKDSREQPGDFSSSSLSVIQRLKNAEGTEDLAMYVGVYVGISLLAGLMGTLRFLFVRVASIRSSQALFQTLLSAVLSAPMRWVDTIPLGRVLNRFTADIYTMDHPLGADLVDLILWILQTCGILAASLYISPTVIAPAAILLAVSIRLAATYLAAAREVKRLESISRTPILEQFTSSLVGLATIRAFDRTNKYVRSMFDCIDTYSKVSWNLWLLNWWLQIRINLLGALFCTTVAALVVKLGVPASWGGFAISFLLQYSTAVSSAIRFYANFEMDMNATERVIDYASIEVESQGGRDPPAVWPTKGHVAVKNLVVGYSPELPAVLKGVSFTIESNERVGVVGRTGSGKSTLALSLFRFLEARQGQIYIDGLDSSTLKLRALRRGLAIVPQQPTLFSGTIRSNLDPFDWYPDTELNDCLERVHLMSDQDTLHTFSLDSPVSDGGGNFSQGQRQLLCLARAILQRPKVMILDEATSAVDMETDGYIQQAIRSEFGRNMSSLLVIAHRLSTVADFDRILVMDDGQIVESGTPKELLSIEGGHFQNLVNHSGEKALLERTIYGPRM